MLLVRHPAGMSGNLADLADLCQSNCCHCICWSPVAGLQSLEGDMRADGQSPVLEGGWPRAVLRPRSCEVDNAGAIWC